MRRTLVAVVLLLGPMAWLGLPSAQIQNPVSWSLGDGPKNLAPGARFELRLTARIEDGWHLYSITQPPGGPIQTRITVPEGQRFRLAAAPAGPPPIKAFDPNFSMQTEWYDDEVGFVLPIVVAPDTPAGTHRVEVHVRFQTCNDRLCLPPKTEKLFIDVAVAGRSATTRVGDSGPIAEPVPVPAPERPGAVPEAAANAAPASQTAAVPLPAAAQANLWSFIWLAMTVGALSLLTPCVFPMGRSPSRTSRTTRPGAGGRRSATPSSIRSESS